MSEGIAPGVKQLILPFSVLSENRKEPFTFDLEAASVFSLAEMDRAKGGGLISRQPEEKIVFISKMGYPLWLFPWSETTLIFDGLNRSNYTQPYAVIPDVKPFMENLKRASNARETHVAFLADHINYFQAPVTEKGVLIKGLIRDPEFLSAFDSYRHEAIAVEDQPTNMALLSPIIEESTISSILQELENLHFTFKEEFDRLHRCMKFINKATQQFIKELRGNAKAVKEEFDVKIRAQEELVAPKVARIKEDYDQKIIESSKTFDKQRLPVQKEKIKLEKSREQALAKIENYKLEAKTHAEKDDSVGEQKFKEKSSETKKELSDIEDELKKIEKALKDMGESKSLEVFNLRSELEAKIKETRQPLLELESSRDAKILLYNQEIEKLEQQTKLITEQLGRAAKIRESGIAQFAALGVKQDLELNEAALFYVPFYAVCYQVESKKRYLILLPSEANAIGLSTKLKGALGRARIKQLLVPRFDALIPLMDSIQVLAQQSAMFENEMREKGEKTNMLIMGSVRGSIKKGLESLKQEGWLSDKEYQVFSQKIA
jgi:uncharacterized protein YukE